MTSDPGPIETIEIQEYEPDPNRSGYLRRTRRKTVAEVEAFVQAGLRAMDIEIDESMHRFPGMATDAEFPRYDHLACFAVTGGSEGHYIHVEALKGDSRTLVMLGKTFMGWDHACKMAKACAELLGA